MPPGADLARYKAALLERFANPGPEAPHMADRHGRLAEAAAAPARHDPRPAGGGAPIDRLALGVAAWMRYVGGVDEHGQPIDVRDPLADRLKSLPDGTSLLGVREVFGDDLPNNPTFVAAVTKP